MNMRVVVQDLLVMVCHVGVLFSSVSVVIWCVSRMGVGLGR